MGCSCIKEEYSQSKVENKQTPQPSNLDLLEEFDDFQSLTNSNTQLIHQLNQDEKISIQDFILIQILGKGSYGKVILVKHKTTQMEYAMKILQKARITNDRQKRHTQAERIILEKMNSPFIVKLHFAFQTSNKLYLIVDYISGGELYFLLKRETKLTEKMIKFYAIEILLAIEYLHKNQVIYRDLKPENILLTNDGHIKLTDFGLSKICVANETQTYSLCGTPEYLAPEVLTAFGYDKQCDWWSYGAILYEMYTGLCPFYSQNKKEMMKNKIQQQVRMPYGIDPDAQNLLLRLLCNDPRRRLGYKDDAREIMHHQYFSGVNFEDYRNFRVKAPCQFIGLFDQNLGNLQNVQDTPIKQNDIKYENFSNFTYQRMEFIQSEDQMKLTGVSGRQTFSLNCAES